MRTSCSRSGASHGSLSQARGCPGVNWSRKKGVPGPHPGTPRSPLGDSATTADAVPHAVRRQAGNRQAGGVRPADRPRGHARPAARRARRRRRHAHPVRGAVRRHDRPERASWCGEHLDHQRLPQQPGRLHAVPPATVCGDDHAVRPGRTAKLRTPVSDRERFSQRASGRLGALSGMSERQEGSGGMTDAGRTAVNRFVGELNRLVVLTAELPHPLPRSTISDKLNARSLPEWEFVASFVAACAAHAEPPLPPDMVDLNRWAERHLAMLRAVDGAQAAGRLAASARAELDRRVRPRQLPAAPKHFAGREAELAALDQLAERGAVSVVGGTAGVGKTTLAVHWACRAADRFPDGQLYVNLRGYGPDAPLTPAEAVRGFLEAFAVPPKETPATADGLTGLYRSLLAGKRMLVLLDNARDAEQVRPLLPGSPAAWHWSPAATGSPAWSRPTVPVRCRWPCSRRARHARCSRTVSARTVCSRNPVRWTGSSPSALGCPWP